MRELWAIVLDAGGGIVIRMGWRSSMKRMVRTLCALAVAATAFTVVAANGEPTWETEPAHSVQAVPGEPTWENPPVDLGA